MIFSNLFLIDDEFVCIDYEWVLDFPVPLEYIFYRVIHHHHVVNPVFRDFISVEEVFDHFDLDKNNIGLFDQWDRNFLDHVSFRLKRPKTKITSKAYVNKLDTLNDTEKKYRDANKKYRDVNEKYRNLLIKYQDLLVKYQDLENSVKLNK